MESKLSLFSFSGAQLQNFPIRIHSRRWEGVLYGMRNFEKVYFA